MTDNVFPVNDTMNQFSTSFFFRSEVNEKVEDRNSFLSERAWSSFVGGRSPSGEAGSAQPTAVRVCREAAQLTAEPTGQSRALRVGGLLTLLP